MAFKVSTHAGCGKEGCHSGVAMDDDEYFEGYAHDTIYPPCSCHPKYCPTCRGSGMTEEDDDGAWGDCPDCRAGWRGSPEHPDCRYSNPDAWREFLKEDAQ